MDEEIYYEYNTCICKNVHTETKMDSIREETKRKVGDRGRQIRGEKEGRERERDSLYLKQLLLSTRQLSRCCGTNSLRGDQRRRCGHCGCQHCHGGVWSYWCHYCGNPCLFGRRTTTFLTLHWQSDLHLLCVCVCVSVCVCVCTCVLLQIFHLLFVHVYAYTNRSTPKLPHHPNVRYMHL